MRDPGTLNYICLYPPTGLVKFRLIHLRLLASSLPDYMCVFFPLCLRSATLEYKGKS